MIVFEVLNLIVQACPIEVVGSVVEFDDLIKEDNNIFDVGTSMEESSCALVVGELSLFKRLYVLLATCVDPLAWWWIHETESPNVSFFAKQILEIERMFNLVGVLTTLKCCRLQVDNLN
jgi:uncharacterized Tic20 family protein